MTGVQYVRFHKNQHTAFKQAHHASQQHRLDGYHGSGHRPDSISSPYLHLFDGVLFRCPILIKGGKKHCYSNKWLQELNAKSRYKAICSRCR